MKGENHGGKEIYEKYRKLSSKFKVKLNELTYRQYLALSYIVSKISSENKYPSKDEIKKVIGFTTDRMLYITLKALERKGFIKFNGLDSHPICQITEITQQLREVLEDRLLLIKNFTTYLNVRNKVKDVRIVEKLSAPQLPLLEGLELVRYLNNEKHVVHRWYTYLEDFPPGLVWKYIESFRVSREHKILDPFVGSGTTCVVAKLRGIDNIGVDINPVASFVTRVKTSFDRIPIGEFKKEAETILNEISQLSTVLKNCRLATKVLERMPKMELYQWLKPITQNYVAYARERVDEVENQSVREVLELALIESALESSNATFCPSTTFYPFRRKPSFPQAFKEEIQKMYEDLFLLSRAGAEWGNSTVLVEDSKEMSRFIDSNDIDFIFTSPPYPNDLEYTRQTKLELYLLGFIESEKDIQQIKRKMIKSSTKLIYRESNSDKYVEKYESIQLIVSKLEKAFSDKNWGWNYPKMVAEYFGDLHIVLSELREVLKKDGIACFVVGDQTYKGILIPVGKILCEIAADLGFKTRLELFRVRRSTLHDIPLKEEVVILEKEEG